MPRHYRPRRIRLPRPMRSDPIERMHDQAGLLRDRYEAYAAAARQLGERVKTFDEWLNS